jgi:pimeloyl-ACP methyl ester carboxylesterase
VTARFAVTRGEVSIEVLADGGGLDGGGSNGGGAPIVLLPSLGRGAEDFDAIAARLAAAGFKVLRPQPRGIGASRGPLAEMDLHDCAADIAAVIEAARCGSAFVVGHAFGNRVARMLATDRPDLVRAISLVAANVGRDPSPPDVRAAIRASADATLSDAARLDALRYAFFAPGNDPSAWLAGWHPHVLAAQRIAGDQTSREEDFAGGTAPILYLQPTHDPLAHGHHAQEYRSLLGDRVTIVMIPQASHAAIAEQPEFISDALIAFAHGLGAPFGAPVADATAGAGPAATASP